MNGEKELGERREGGESERRKRRMTEGDGWGLGERERKKEMREERGN